MFNIYFIPIYLYKCILFNRVLIGLLFVEACEEGSYEYGCAPEHSEGRWDHAE